MNPIRNKAFIDELSEKIRGGYIPTRRDRERMHQAVVENIDYLGGRLIRTTWMAALLAGLAIGHAIFAIVTAIVGR